MKKSEAALSLQVASLTSQLSSLQSLHTSLITSTTLEVSALQSEVTRLTSLTSSLNSSLTSLQQINLNQSLTLRLYEQKLHSLGVSTVDLDRQVGVVGGSGMEEEVEMRVAALRERVERRLEVGGKSGGGASTPYNTPRSSGIRGRRSGVEVGEMRVMEGIEEGPLLHLDEEVKVLSDRESMGTPQRGCGVSRLSVEAEMMDRSISESEIFASAF